MEKFKVSFEANNQQLKAIGTKHASDTYADIEAEFVLGNRWTDMDSVSAVWWNDFTRIATVLDSQGKCIVPHEVLTRKGCVRVNLVGSIVEGDELITRLTSYSAEAVQVNEKIKLTGNETSEITPSQFEQFVAVVIAEVEKVTGMTAQAETLPAGSQATARYENGILYLGIPQGIQGERGETGADGNGIASVVYNADYSLTLIFDNGEQFRTPPIRGERGPAGADGRDGTDGRDGADGVTPNLTIGTVETLEPTESATATITGTDENPVLNLGLPKGDTGEVSRAELDNAVSDLKSDLGYFEKESIGILSKLGGGITRATVLNGTINNPNNDHFVHTNHCPVIAGSYAQIINNKALQSDGNYYKYAWQIFDSGHNYIGGRDLDTGTREGKVLIPTNGAYIAYDIGEYDSSNNYDGIRQTDFSSYDVGIKVYTEENLFNAVDAIEKDADLTWHSDGINGSVYEWENKRINAVDGSIVDSTNRLKIKDPIPKYIDNISFVGYECGLFAYRADGTFVGWWNGSTWKINNLDWIVNSITIPKGQPDDDYDMYIVLRKPSNVDISSNDANDFSFFTKYNYLNKRISDIENDVVGVNYAITADMLKKNVNITKLGTLTYHQSFLKYNGKYYSTDGDNIAVQDVDFNPERSVPLNVGHGNAFCLGSGNKGYISGWDDNKIYVINLDTLTIESELNLPTTGYTTCAVDDENSLIYIFQRDSYPNTKAIYNLIVYDYQNEQIISTNKVPVAMSAMQACDIYHGRIVVLYGGGVSTKPNGYIVCDTNGNVIGEYVLGSFSSLEPEGVFFDRDTHDLMFSFIDKMLYKIY